MHKQELQTKTTNSVSSKPLKTMVTVVNGKSIVTGVDAPDRISETAMEKPIRSQQTFDFVGIAG